MNGIHHHGLMQHREGRLCWTHILGLGFGLDLTMQIYLVESPYELAIFLNSIVFRGYDNSNGTPMNPFQNETLKRASERVTKKKYKKRVLKGGQKVLQNAKR